MKRAETLKFEIQEFIKTCGNSSSLPRASRNMSLQTMEDTTSHITDDERDEIATYLCKTYPELIDLRKSDLPSLIHDTISFLCEKTCSIHQQGNILGLCIANVF